MIRVTQTTARFILKTIFRKTGLHRQSELIGMLGRLPLD
jgi:DNA-binding CsgD family transcriptional regulator